MSSIKITFIFLATLSAGFTAINSAPAATADQMMELREHINKGNVFLNHNQFDKALDEYDKCLMIDPGNQTAKENIVLAHNNCGMMFYYQKRYQDAKAEWDEALKLNPYDRNIKRNLGILKATLDRLEQQGAAKKTAASDKPDTAANNDGATASGAVMINGAPKPAPQEAPPTSGAVLLNSGKKHSEGPADSGATATSPSPAAGTYEEIPTYNGGTIRILSGRQHAVAEPPSSSAPAAVIISPVTTAPPASNVSTVPAVSSPATVSTPTAVYNHTDVAPASDTIEEKLNQIEMKVYGKTQGDAPVFKRLEKLEMDTGGAVKSGSVQQRVETLRRAYGI